MAINKSSMSEFMNNGGLYSQQRFAHVINMKKQWGNFEKSHKEL